MPEPISLLSEPNPVAQLLDGVGKSVMTPEDPSYPATSRDSSTKVPARDVVTRANLL